MTNTWSIPGSASKISHRQPSGERRRPPGGFDPAERLPVLAGERAVGVDHQHLVDDGACG
jgi:hypothetical protein